MQYLQKIKDQLDEMHIVRPSRIKPCTQKEVEQLEHKLGAQLPLAYKEFLLWMGHGAGGILRGSDCFYWHLIDIQQGAIELLAENAFPEKLPDAAFVFLMHQGYTFVFFRINQGDDPEVYHYMEVEMQTTYAKVATHYSDYLSSIITLDAGLLQKFAENPPQTILSDPVLRESVEYYRKWHHLP